MDLRAMLKAMKVKQLLPPELKNNGAFDGNTYIDTQGLGALLVLINLGVTDVIVGSNDTSTPLLLEECDTSDGSYTAIEDAELSAVLGTGDDGKSYGIFVDLAKTHKRYMRVQAPTADDSTGANLQITALGFPSDALPKSAAEMGLTELVEA
jgi:hypothetical protein